MCKTLVLSSEYQQRFGWRLSLYLSPIRKRSSNSREMAVDSPTGVIITVAVLLYAAASIVCSSDAVLQLERLIPPNHELGLTELRAFDSARHGRLLQSPVGGVVNFPVDGASDPFLVGYCSYSFAYLLYFEFFFLFWYLKKIKIKFLEPLLLTQDFDFKFLFPQPN